TWTPSQDSVPRDQVSTEPGQDQSSTTWISLSWWVPPPLTCFATDYYIGRSSGLRNPTEDSPSSLTRLCFPAGHRPCRTSAGPHTDAQFLQQLGEPFSRDCPHELQDLDFTRLLVIARLRPFRPRGRRRRRDGGLTGREWGRRRCCLVPALFWLLDAIA